MTKPSSKEKAASWPALRTGLPGRLLSAIALAATLVLAPLLTFSEATIKSILDRWLSQCLLVIETSAADESKTALVRLHAFGAVPSELPLSFVLNQDAFERISLVNHVEAPATGGETNLLVHPQANQNCPGELCQQQSAGGDRLTLRIKPFGSNYLYQFRVRSTSGLSDIAKLKVYVQPRGSDSVGCRVEQASLTNLVARQGKIVQIALLFVAAVVLTLLLGYLKRAKGESA